MKTLLVVSALTAMLAIVPAFELSAMNSDASTNALTRMELREIDRLAAQLVDYSKELHDEYHRHLEGVRHAEKLERDVSTLERIAESLHRFAHDAIGSENDMKRLREDTNEFLLLASRISRTIDLAQPWMRSSNTHTGMRHMRAAAQEVYGIARRIDAFLPVDTEVIDSQADRLETAVKILHDQFHKYLEGYEISSHLDDDLENLENLVEHLHDLAHGNSWAEIDLRRVSGDVRQIIQETQHIEELFVQQSRIGVRTRDWIGIEHARDAITDVLASANLLDHMVAKTDPRNRSRHDHVFDPRRDFDRSDEDDRRHDHDRFTEFRLHDHGNSHDRIRRHDRNREFTYNYENGHRHN